MILFKISKSKDIRWKQRFQNFVSALSYLQEAVEIKNPDIIQKAGLIQFFEICFELGGNLIKDYLQDQAFTDIRSPRSALKKGFEIGLIQNGHSWMQLIDDRNITAHTYDEATVNKVHQFIADKYFPLLKELYDTFRQK
ncbi:MAG: nucleotidyltransferase substrate binding protein [Chitinophagaceae bacterium]